MIKFLKFSMFFAQSVFIYKLMELLEWNLSSFKTIVLLILFIIIISGNRFLGFLDK